MYSDKVVARVLKKVKKYGVGDTAGLIRLYYDAEAPVEERKAAASILQHQDEFEDFLKDGGPGSGNFGHKGRPGQIGGSGEGGGSKLPQGLSHEQKAARWSSMTPEEYTKTKLNEFPDGVNPKVKAFYEKAAQSEPKITASMNEFAKECNARMDGIDYRMKDGDSFMRKVRKEAKEEGMTQVEAADSLYDAVRYTQVSDEKNLVNNCKNTLTKMKKAGYNIVAVKNTWKDPENAYNGINVKCVSPDGQKFELQFHTPDSLEVKEKIHGLYEEQRKLSKKDPRWRELNDQMFAISNGQKRPDSIEDL